jgi:hypothetical protein
MAIDPYVCNWISGLLPVAKLLPLFTVDDSASNLPHQDKDGHET